MEVLAGLVVVAMLLLLVVRAGRETPEDALHAAAAERDLDALRTRATETADVLRPNDY